MKIEVNALQERLRDLQEHFCRAASQNRADGMLPFAAKSEAMAEGVREAMKLVRRMEQGG